MKSFIAPTYTFTPGVSGVGTIDLSGISSFNIKYLVSIINQTKGEIVYSTASASLRYTNVTGTTITLFKDTSAMSSGDVLQIIYETQTETLPTGAATELKQDTGNTSLNSIDGKLTTLNANDFATSAKQDTGNTSVASIDTKTPALVSGKVPVETGLTQSLTNTQLRAAPIEAITQNIVTKFRDAFEDYTPGDNWNQVLGSNDLIHVDGNAAGTSYLVISKCPLSTGTESSITSDLEFSLPVEMAIGLSMSQRTVGQEFAMEIVDSETPLPDVSDLEIASISQATTTLTVNTVLAHGLSVGKSIGIVGCSDSRANYPAVVVASVPSPTQFTVTAGPAGVITSQTITNPVGAKGSVFFRERLGRAQNGISQIFENTSVTQTSLYIRSESGDALPSGVVAGAHVVTTGTTLPVQVVNSPYQYAFAPTTEYRIFAQADRVQWADSAIDSVTQTTNRLLRTQICPDPNVNYKFRIRAVNNKSLTVPNAQIVSAVKTGTTTATITTDVAHGLVAGDLVTVYGIANQAATAFPNLVTATAISSTPTTTSFTIVIGTAASVTSYGGVIAKVQGGILPSTLGYSTVVPVSATLTTLSNGTRQLLVPGNASWAGLVIGDGVNLVGVRNTVNGASLGVDGAWKVASVSAANLFLVPMPGNIPPSDFTITNCGGAVIKRTEMRVSFVRIFDFERQRVEMLARPAGDLAAAMPVVLQGGTTAVTTVGSITAVTTVGSITSANLAIPGTIADVASAALTTTTTTATLTPTFGISYQVNIPVTAVTGTNPTLDASIEESDDSGTNWFKVYDYPRITATGIYRSPVIPLTGNRIRYVQTVGGTTPSFTRAVNRLQSSYPALPQRQLVDRTIVLTTLNSVTPVLLTRDCGNATQLVINIGAATTAPQIQLEGSDDFGATWYSIGSPLTAVASSTVQVTVDNINAAAVRARVSTAGVGVTAGYVMIKAHD